MDLEVELKAIALSWKKKKPKKPPNKKIPKDRKSWHKPSKAHARLNLLVITFIFKHNQSKKKKKKRKKKAENVSLFSIPYASQASSVDRVDL